jgi:hypothetical protein
LFAAGEVLREAAGATMRPTVRAQYESIRAAAHALLDEEAWDAAWTEGRAMTPEQAIAYALGEAI